MEEASSCAPGRGSSEDRGDKKRESREEATEEKSRSRRRRKTRSRQASRERKKPKTEARESSRSRRRSRRVEGSLERKETVKEEQTAAERGSGSLAEVKEESSPARGRRESRPGSAVPSSAHSRTEGVTREAERGSEGHPIRRSQRREERIREDEAPPPGRWTLTERPAEPLGPPPFRPPQPKGPPPGWQRADPPRKSKGITRELRNQDIRLYGPDPARKQVRETAQRG